MVDYHKNIVNALSDILPTHYEMVLTSKTATPCISYMELSNSSAAKGNTQEYSRLQYQVKVWANDISIIQEKALLIDSSLRSIGFTRVASTELYDNNSAMIQKILTYEALANEVY